MLFANLDVTTHVLASVLALLGKSEQIQEDIRTEIRQMNETEVDYCGQTQTLLHYSYLESLRLRPFTGKQLLSEIWTLLNLYTNDYSTVFSIPESSPSDKILGDYRIPANVSTLLPVMVV